MSNDGNDDDVCIACNIALKNGDKFYFDVDGGYLHAACAGPEREGYVGADGEPLKDGDPIPDPKTWVDSPPSSPVAGGGEELKPCPFCGSEAEWQTATRPWPYDDVRRISCSNDECPVQPTANASAAWNTRSPLLSSPRQGE